MQPPISWSVFQSKKTKLREIYGFCYTGGNSAKKRYTNTVCIKKIVLLLLKKKLCCLDSGPCWPGFSYATALPRLLWLRYSGGGGAWAPLIWSGEGGWAPLVLHCITKSFILNMSCKWLIIYMTCSLHWCHLHFIDLIWSVICVNDMLVYT